MTEKKETGKKNPKSSETPASKAETQNLEEKPKRRCCKKKQ